MERDGATLDGLGSLSGRTRRKVERVDKAEAQGDLEGLLAARAGGRDPEQTRLRQATSDELIDEWLAARCPNVIPTKGSRHVKEKAPNTVSNAKPGRTSH